MIKKYIALICIAVLLIMPLELNVIAAEDYKQEIELLETLGVIKGYKDGAFVPEAEMTRAELAMLSVCALGLGENTVSDTLNYLDVPNGYWAADYITTATKLNIMVGYNGYFEPDEPVDATQASKVMVQMLGYEFQAQLKGGYPIGYLTVANQLGLLSKVDTNGTFTRGKAARMLYNALHTEPLELKYLYGGDSAIYSEGNRILMEITLGVREADGRVESNYIASLWGDPGCRENELMIDNSI